jgi:hypothetical protein
MKKPVNTNQNYFRYLEWYILGGLNGVFFNLTSKILDFTNNKKIFW